MVVQEGPENNIAFTFAFDLKVSSCSCYIIFRPPGGASTFALRLMLLPPLPLPIWYTWLGDDILHPVIGFLRFQTCLKAFYVCYICFYFQTDSFHSGMVYFFYMVLYRFIAGSCSKHQNSSGNGIYLFLDDLASQSFK